MIDPTTKTRLRPTNRFSRHVDWTQNGDTASLEQGDDNLAVRIQVASPSPLDPRYEITMIEPDEKCAEDVVLDGYGFEVVMEPETAKLLDGARVDWIETLTESGFKVENPNLAPIGSKPL